MMVALLAPEKPSSQLRPWRSRGHLILVAVSTIVFWFTFRHLGSNYSSIRCTVSSSVDGSSATNCLSEQSREERNQWHLIRHKHESAKEDGHETDKPQSETQHSEEKIDTPRSGEKQESQADVTIVEEADQHPLPAHVLAAFPHQATVDGSKAKIPDLPEIVFIPLEQAAQEVTLHGWEDEWLSQVYYNETRWNKLDEPMIDFVYNWVNGSEEAFKETKHEYELASRLNDADGKWLQEHSVNRYRDWDELRYSFRSIETNAAKFMNKIQILVNTVKELNSTSNELVTREQRPSWLKRNSNGGRIVEVLPQEDFFGEDEKQCLPTFNSLTIENQIHNTKSDTDRMFSLSDDMFFGMEHAASDLYSPLFGPTMGFKTDSYNVKKQPGSSDAARFGEKPYLIYTSWLLGRRFGERQRKGQVHFGHSLSRNVTREAIATFPRPAAQSACERFRGETTGFQLYSWYATFHYTMERFREALLWSYITIRMDTREDNYLDWPARQRILAEIREGKTNIEDGKVRERMFFKVPQLLRKAGLEPPKVNIDILWTSLDGPVSIMEAKCEDFDPDQCMAEGFSSPASDAHFKNPTFSTSSVFDRLARQNTHCGDCFIKSLLNRATKGLEPMLPDKSTQAPQREIVVKALTKYQYTIINPDAQFFMIKDGEQARNLLLERMLYRERRAGQLCFNDDVLTEDETAVGDVKRIINEVFGTLFPVKSSFEV